MPKQKANTEVEVYRGIPIYTHRVLTLREDFLLYCSELNGEVSKTASLENARASIDYDLDVAWYPTEV